MGHDQGGPSVWGASKGAAGVSASDGARTKSMVQLAETWGPSLFGEVVAEASMPRESEVDVPASSHPRGFVHGALREEVTNGRFGGWTVGGSPGLLAEGRAKLERTVVERKTSRGPGTTTVRRSCRQA